MATSSLLQYQRILAISIAVLISWGGYSNTNNACLSSVQSFVFTGSTSRCSANQRLLSQQSRKNQISLESTANTADASDTARTIEYNPNSKPSKEWELDCYSRPVVVNGKKLWEVLITDSTGSFRLCEALPSNRVNSRELRRVVESAVEEAEESGGARTRPSTIRFFRGAMFNMINIALNEIDVVAKPSRATYALAQWLEEREREVYPKMEGYRANMASSGTSDPTGSSFLDIRTPIKLPDALRGERYAFVSLPLAEFQEGGGVTEENIGVGRLCPIDDDLPGDAFVQGIVIMTKRAKGLSSWLAGTEVASLKCDLRRRTLTMEADIETQYLMAKLNDEQRNEGRIFEAGKEELRGLHFVCVQKDEEDDEPAGFWLLRQMKGF